MREVSFPARYRYLEGYLPPRCRKLRCRPAWAETNVTFPIYSPTEAQLAFAHKVGICDGAHIRTYRLVGSKLYARIRHDEGGAMQPEQGNDYIPMVSWDTGGSLSVVYGEDACHIVQKE